MLGQEPPPPDHPLLALDNAIVTPHAAFYSVTAIAELQAKAATNVADVLSGRLPGNRGQSRGAGARGLPGRAVTTAGRGAVATGGFVLTAETAVPYLVRRGILREGSEAVAAELAGGVSSAVVAVRAPGVRVVVKQALPRLKVTDDWRAKLERTELEVAALRLLRPPHAGPVPRVVDSDPEAHVVVMELLPDDARNWQDEIGLGRAHVDGRRVGRARRSALWHARHGGRLRRSRPRSPITSRSSSCA